MYRRIIESPYGSEPDNFHVSRSDDELHVTLTYPPWTDADNRTGQIRHLVVDQESVRASDGIRVWYDYARDGFVIEQNAPTMEPTGPDSSTDVAHWREVFFAKSWALTPDDVLD